jgi:hypothetical protein
MPRCVGNPNAMDKGEWISGWRARETNGKAVFVPMLQQSLPIAVVNYVPLIGIGGRDKVYKGEHYRISRNY